MVVNPGLSPCVIGQLGHLAAPLPMCSSFLGIHFTMHTRPADARIHTSVFSIRYPSPLSAPAFDVSLVVGLELSVRKRRRHSSFSPTSDPISRLQTRYPKRRENISGVVMSAKNVSQEQQALSMTSRRPFIKRVTESMTPAYKMTKTAIQAKLARKLLLPFPSGKGV